MKSKKGVICLSFFFIMLFAAGSVFSQESARSVYLRRFQNGTQLYQGGRWFEAAVEFRRAQETANSLNDWSAAIYWVILSELAYSDYGSAIRDMDELEKNAPNTAYARDMVYHRARIYYNQGYFDDSLVLFRRYIDSIPDESRQFADRKAAAFFWMGECLYAMGQYDEAQKFYTWVIASFPVSPKIEISTYRIDLIKQKKIEAELLALLQWSHEESLRTSEEYQRRLKTYEYTLNSYQRRIAELLETAPLPTPEINPESYIEPHDIDPPVYSNGNGVEVPVIESAPDENGAYADDISSNAGTLTEHDLLIKARNLSYELQFLIDNYNRGGFR